MRTPPPPPHALVVTCRLAAGADVAEAAELLGVGLASTDPRGLLDAWAVWTGERVLEIAAVFADAERAGTGLTDVERIVARHADRLTITEVREGAAVNLPAVARGNRPVRLRPAEPSPEYAD